MEHIAAGAVSSHHAASTQQADRLTTLYLPGIVLPPQNYTALNATMADMFDNMSAFERACVIPTGALPPDVAVLHEYSCSMTTPPLAHPASRVGRMHSPCTQQARVYEINC